MSLAIDRNFDQYDQSTITSDENTTGQYGLGAFAGGLLYVISTSTGAAQTISWRAKFLPSSASYKLYDSTNAAITTVIQAGRCYEIPGELYGAMGISAVSDTAGQTAVVRVTVKG
jgi:hypothetical protein